MISEEDMIVAYLKNVDFQGNTKCRVVDIYRSRMVSWQRDIAYGGILFKKMQEEFHMVERYMENQYLKVTVADHGAELVSVYDKERDFERIWCADPSIWNRHAPILFPFVGRVWEKKYRCPKGEYPMTTQHGFARDMEFVCTEVTDVHIVHMLKATEDSKKVYPYDFELQVTHEFDRENPRMLHVKWLIINHDSDTMYYCIGGHPGFTVPENSTEKRSDYFLSFPENHKLEYMLINPGTGFGIPEVTYELKPENHLVPIDDHFFDRDALIFEHSQVSVVGISDPEGKPYITMRCADFPSVGIWSQPDGPYVCLEPWKGRTDNQNFTGTLAEKPDIQVLSAGQQSSCDYTIEFH